MCSGIEDRSGAPSGALGAAKILSGGKKIMSITRYDPFRDLKTLQDEVNRLFSTNFSDRKSTRLNSSHVEISYAVFCLKKKTIISSTRRTPSRPPTTFRSPS